MTDPRPTKPEDSSGSAPGAGWFRDPAVVFREPLCVSPARARRLRERALRVLAEGPAPRRSAGGR